MDNLNELATVLTSQGKYEAAEEMNRRALKGKEKVLGMEHPSTLTSVSNLASVLQSQGEYKTAEEMNQRILEGSEKMLGMEHPDTLTSVSNQALILQYQGKYEGAEEMNRRALKGREKVLGMEHPDTLISASKLAEILRHQEKHKAAEEMNRRTSPVPLRAGESQAPFLSKRWEARQTKEGQIYYVDHKTKSTTWVLPEAPEEQWPLPEGWEARRTEEGQTYYVDNKTKSKSWVLPLLAGWEARRTEEGRIYYVNHKTKSTSWVLPDAPEVQWPLPEGWELGRTDDGRIYYVDHKTKSTSWVLPDAPEAQCPLPEGWEARRTEEGQTYYVDNNTKSTSLVHPPECTRTKRLRVPYPCTSHPGIDQSSYLSSSGSDFLYSSVLTSDEIRLIQFHGNLEDDQISCSLVVRHFDDSLVYNALSYTWGDQHSKSAITCNGSHLEIGQNLFSAMRQIRKDNPTELLWADALCINQADNTEKATQVKMMRNIYQRAKLVIAWLGEEEDTDHLAFQLMDLLNSRFQHRWTIEDQRIKKVNFWSVKELGIPDRFHPSWKALCSIFTRPYFFRVWIIQEILVAKDCVFQFGKYSVDRRIIFGIGACREEFHVIEELITLNTPVNGSWADDSPRAIANSILSDFSTPALTQILTPDEVQSLTTEHPVKSLWQIRSRMTAGEPLSITQLLYRTRMYQSTVPQDKIFALVGLASDLDRQFLDKFIDYDKPLVDVQIELAKVCMHSRLSWGSSLFSYVDAQRQSDELPSWVPDWTRGGPIQRSLSEGFCHQRADRQSKWQLGSNNSMTMYGVLFDTIDCVIDEIPHMQIESPRNRDIGIMMRNLRELKAWEDKCFGLAPCPPSARPGCYITGENILDAFWRTLIFNREYEGLEDAPPDMKKAYLIWCLTLQLLRYTSQTLKQLLDAPTSETSKQPKTVLGRLYNLASSILLFFKRQISRVTLYFLRLASETMRVKGEYRFLSAFGRYSFGRKFCTTRGGAMGWVPLGAERHDLLCVFEECELPFILRKRADGYKLIGDSYVHGVMTGIPDEIGQRALQAITLV